MLTRSSACSCVDVNNGTALNLSCEHSLNDCGHLGKANHMSRSRKLVQIQVPRQT